MEKGISFRKELCIAVLIFALPFTFPIHTLFSETTNVISFFGYEFSHGHVDNQYYIYSLTVRLVSTAYLILWILLNKQLTKTFVLIPLLIFAYKLTRSTDSYNVFNDNYPTIGICIAIVLFSFCRFRSLPKDIIEKKRFFNTFLGILIVLAALTHILSFQKFMEKPSLDFVLFKMGSQGFDDVSIMIYYTSIKALLFIPLLFWFLMENRWWRYALLSPIIIISMQLYNTFTTFSEDIDVIEVFQTLHFTVPLFIILFFLAKAFDNQEKIQAWINAQYILLEHSIKQKFHQKEGIIKTAREQLKNKDLGLKGLEALKTRLEKEVNS